MQNADSELEKLGKMRMGIHHAPMEVLVLDEDAVKRHNLEREYVKPLLEGKDVHKWRTTWRNLYIVFPHERINGKIVPIDLERAPHLRNYLEIHSERLENRRYYRKKITQYGKRWYEIWNPFWFEQPKIITPHISKKNNFTYDEKFYGNVNVYAIIPDNKDKEFAFYLLGLLNSRIIEFYFKHVSVFVSGQYYLYKHEYLGSLPIKLPSTKKEKDLASHVIQKVQDIIQLADHESLLGGFPVSYLQSYLAQGIELDEISYIFSLDHRELRPTISGQAGKAFAVYPGKGEDPIFVETEEKAQYLTLFLRRRAVKRDHSMKLMIPRDNAVVRRILNDFRARLEELEKTPIEQLEKEIDVLVYQLYGLGDDEVAIIEDYLKRF
jgi:hypothetical protein